jgi:hypothetical protein
MHAYAAGVAADYFTETFEFQHLELTPSENWVPS